MASAGRILIMPQGEWNSSTEYEMLDLVKYNGTSWLAKKTVVGIEPSDANVEYWHKLIDLNFGASTGGLQIATGNYTGANVFGEDNKTYLALNFEPKVVIISTGTTFSGVCVWHYGATVTTMTVAGTTSTQNIFFELSGNTLSWYNTSQPSYQLNDGSMTYHWVAIG